MLKGKGEFINNQISPLMLNFLHSPLSSIFMNISIRYYDGSLQLFLLLFRNNYPYINDDYIK